MNTPTPAEVVFYEAFEEEECALRRLLPSRCQALFRRNTLQTSGDLRPPAPLICIRTQSVIPPSWLGAVTGILARTTGYDHLRPYLENAPHVALACLPEYCSRAVAEQAALLWMALLRRLPRQQAQWARFDRDGLTGGECAGRTLVVVGVGRIGYEVARIGQGLGMKVIAVDLVHRHTDLDYQPWPKAAAQADIVAACMDLNPSSHHYFNATSLAHLKGGALLINVARGELTDAEAVVAALDQGTLGGWAADVYEEETAMADALRGTDPAPPRFARYRDWARRPNVLFTPHNAFNTLEAVERKSIFTVEQVLAFGERRTFRWPWTGP